ncbi:MAG: NAD(P)H-dependent oxidoreductase subunit E [Thermomicrobium sp.]|nr:NAD(P)H-dependent oxidoreductase subunit E [Thermomicrobium sp.]
MELKVPRRTTVDLEPLRRILEERYRPRDHQEAQELIVSACQEAQRLYGWVPPEAAEAIAEHLGVTINRVYGLLTFYADFRTRPPQRHFLWLCYGAACYVAGAGRLVELLREEYGMDEHGDTSDGTLSVHVFNGCLGVCDLAPAAQLDHRAYLGGLNVEGMRALIERLRSGAEENNGGAH